MADPHAEVLLTPEDFQVQAEIRDSSMVLCLHGEMTQVEWDTFLRNYHNRRRLLNRSSVP